MGSGAGDQGQGEVAVVHIRSNAMLSQNIDQAKYRNLGGAILVEDQAVPAGGHPVPEDGPELPASGHSNLAA